MKLSLIILMTTSSIVPIQRKPSKIGKSFIQIKGEVNERNSKLSICKFSLEVSFKLNIPAILNVNAIVSKR